MSIATGDKKISLRVGGKDLTLNEDSKSFLPMRNPEDIPSNLVVEYSNPFYSATGNTIVMYNHIDGGSSIMRFVNHECEGVSVGIDIPVDGALPISGMYYHNEIINSDSSMWLISHRDDGIYIGNTRVADINGDWILK